MDRHEQRVVAFLSRPSAYPHRVTTIERRETHVSHVFLAGDYAYKLKKPVTFPFLDASTVALRKTFCRLELSLNRRLAPTVYLGIVPVVETASGLRLGPSARPHGTIVDWVVKMRRLPEDRMLDQLVAKRAVAGADMQEVGDHLATFFRAAARSRVINRYGTPEAVRALILGNLSECQPFVGTLLPEHDRAFLESAYRQYLTLHEPLLIQRVREGRIIDGHGDLRCENICLTDPPNIFDCVEFQPAFRCGDMANDFSFLVMDLEFRGRRDLAEALARRYQRRLRDATFEAVLPLYKCHRSLVRGKVRGLAWLQHPRSAEGRRVREISRRHFQLAVEYAREFAPPRLIVVGGLIGSGKSTLAKHLAEGLGATWSRTDEIRRTEFGHLPNPEGNFASGRYSSKVSALVYQRIIRRAEHCVREGRSVVCDGTFSQAAGREALRRVAKRYGASFHFFECVIPKTVALYRIATRHAVKRDLSEARPEHYERMFAGFEPIRGWPATDWTRISDNRPPAQTFHAALAVLRCLWSPQ